MVRKTNKNNKIINKQTLFVMILAVFLVAIIANINLITTQTTQPTPQFQQQQPSFQQQTAPSATFQQQLPPRQLQTQTGASRNIQSFRPGFSRNYNSVYGSSNNFGSAYTQRGAGIRGFNSYGYGLRNNQFGFDPQMCLNRQDFLVNVDPGGCSPAVVRSDLLEEQNVPVFCRLMSFQINPLLSGTRIRSLRVRGQLPKGVSGISYLPSRTAIIRNRDFVSSPLNDNIGHLVVVLSQQFNESSMPDFIEGNISVVIDYDSQGVFGIGKTSFYLNEITEEEWQADYRENSLWNGKAYVRTESIESDRATITIYRDPNIIETTITIKKGETSGDIFLGGFYCAAGMRIKLNDIGAPVESVLLQINGQQVWVSKGDRIINNRCRITNLESYGGGGKVSISCPRNRFDISLTSGKAKFKVHSEEKQKGINEIINKVDGVNIFLGYLGRDSNKQNLAVLVKDPSSSTEREFAFKEVFTAVERVTDKTDHSNIIEEIKKQYRRKNVDTKKIEDLEIKVIYENNEPFNGIILNQVIVAKDRSSEYFDDKELAKEYYDLAAQKYRDLSELYSHEKPIEGQEPFAAEGLLKAAILSKNFGLYEQADSFFNDLITDYPNSNSANQARLEKNRLFKYDKTNSKKVVEVNKIQYSIDLLEFKKPSREEASAILFIKGEEKILRLNEFVSVDNVNVQLTKIDDDKITINYDFTENDKKTSKREILFLTGRGNNQVDVKGVSIVLNHINLKKQAKITITPNSYGTRTETSFKVKIGIEKRAIQLSPDKTKDLMENLQKSIDDWNKINSKLATVVKTLKGACFATSAILTVKNLFEGATGASLARNRLMTTAGGWNDRCEELIGQGTYQTLQQCLLAKSDDIEQDVRLYSEQIKRTNNEIKDIQNRVGIKRTDILDFQGQTDAKKVDEEFKGNFKEFCGQERADVKLPGVAGQTISFNEICSWNSTTHEQRRDLTTLYNIRGQGSEVLKGFVNKELGRITLEAQNINSESLFRANEQQTKNQHNLNVKRTTPVGDRTTYGSIHTVSGTDDNEAYRAIGNGNRAIWFTLPAAIPGEVGKGYKPGDLAGQNIIIPVKQIEGEAGTFQPDATKDFFTANGNKIDDKTQVLYYLDAIKMNRIKEGNKKAYQNQMVNLDRLRVKYFERAPYRGMPSLIPFDVDEGWYVKMDYVLAGFGKPYDQSGRVTNYYICNVGPNGIIEYKKSGDDICRYYNGHSNDLAFSGMSGGESALLVQKAQRAIQEATRQYGQQNVVVGGRSYQSGVSFDTGSGKCTDFMAPTDCNILFNVCDPVICPSSRCDLGGKYRVDNVIQTGIVGSLALCLPNAQEGIAIPICLTGVNAGLDGYISILNSTVACLNESLATGRNIGICDEIKSVYLCDFFWRQATPFLDVLLERTFELVLGQGVRGGGEYLTARHAWENTRSAVDYFKNEYAVNSMRAFQGRSLETIGGTTGAEFCKSFISAGFLGASTSAFEALIEPDSPEQYHAWFTENPLTTATFPPISHYKVYYNIFAGKDIGAFYSVYLKDIPITPGIGSTGFYMVDRGYIGRGSQVDRARDFTGPAGFKQLCININGREECGFGKVSTSYAINAIADAYAQQQAEQTDIISERQCIAGTPSLYSLAQPNIQAGVQDVVQPQLYNKGIVRICSTENPGKQVLPSGEFDRTNSTFNRWKEVGYCDDPTIKCWIDTQSVKNIIRDTGIEQQALNEINLQDIGTQGLLLPDESNTLLSRASERINKTKIDATDDKTTINDKIANIVYDLERVAELGASNIYRARAFLSLGKLYGKIAQTLLNIEVTPLPPQDKVDVDVEPVEPQPTEPLQEPQGKLSEPGTEGVPYGITLPDDDELEPNIRISLNNPQQTRITYEFDFTRGWISTDTTDKRFEGIVRSYAQGIKIIILEKVELGGSINLAGKTWRRTPETNYEEDADLVFDEIIQTLKDLKN